MLVQRPPRIDLVPDQLAAVKAFEALPEAGALSAANKRIVNILRKSGGEAARRRRRRAARPPAPSATCGRRSRRWRRAVDEHCASGDYTSALKALASAKPAVDRFFDDVMVMADDAALRANRLALLQAASRRR